MKGVLTAWDQRNDLKEESIGHGHDPQTSEDGSKREKPKNQ
jgi:hypothetical protein